MVGKFGEVLVVDWGIAKSCRWSLRLMTMSQLSLQIVLEAAKLKSLVGVGTPAYMSPEPCRVYIRHRPWIFTVLSSCIKYSRWNYQKVSSTAEIYKEDDVDMEIDFPDNDADETTRFSALLPKSWTLMRPVLLRKRSSRQNYRARTEVWFRLQAMQFNIEDR